MLSIKEQLLLCARSFVSLNNLQFHYILGKAGKRKELYLSFEPEDLYHLMGLHYLTDRKDRRSRKKIISDMLNNPDYISYLASSDHWDDKLISRLKCVQQLKYLLTKNVPVYVCNPNNRIFFSKIPAVYIVQPESDDQKINIFIDKRSESEYYVCRSIFPAAETDYLHGQIKWSVLYKEIVSFPDNKKELLYKHRSFNPEDKYKQKQGTVKGPFPME